MMDLKESSISATFSTGSCGAVSVANLDANQRQNVCNSSATQLNTSTATPVISLFKLKNFLYQPKFKTLMTSDGKDLRSCVGQPFFVSYTHCYYMSVECQPYHS